MLHQGQLGGGGTSDLALSASGTVGLCNTRVD